ncbi:hypothetical protein BN3590_04477 [Clostridium sp. C105KSO15]|nr:hypothetical protein BN3590_04477 [Clostridium sp. C105KSO15]
MVMTIRLLLSIKSLADAGHFGKISLINAMNSEDRINSAESLKNPIGNPVL